MNKCYLIVFLFFFACSQNEGKLKQQSLPKQTSGMLVVGIAQDAGYPQANCEKDCCKSVWNDPSKRKMVSCLAIVDPPKKAFWLIDATPDFKDQVQMVKKSFPNSEMKLAGVLLTHAHIGHYTGLVHLGREAMGAKEVPIYAMPKMKSFLEENGPWSQLVKLQNISIKTLKVDSVFNLNSNFSIQALQVPHRDEFSETVGFVVKTKSKEVLFIPDIDKWEKWEEDINAWIEKVDMAFLDGSFYENGEIPVRDMNQIPHPFITESMERFKDMELVEKNKIQFIHLNHTNPALRKGSKAFNQILESGFRLAEEGQFVEMN